MYLCNFYFAFSSEMILTFMIYVVGQKKHRIERIYICLHKMFYMVRLYVSLQFQAQKVAKRSSILSLISSIQNLS